MGSGLEVGVPSLASFSAFLAMAIVCLLLSLYFYQKSRTIKKLSEARTATIYGKTFSVFDPFSEARRTHHSFFFFLFFSPLSAVIYSFICVFIVFLPLLYAGLLFWPVAAVLCLSLMMVEEALDVRGTVNVYERAFEKGAPLAPGDLSVLSLLKKVTPRLSAYYFLVALLFIASFLVMPYAFSTLLLAWAYSAGFIFGNLSAAAIPFAIIPAGFLFAIAMVTLHVIGRKLEARVFGFSPSGQLISAVSGEVRRKLLYEKMEDALESEPDQETW
jgi:hypothetical protein